MKRVQKDISKTKAPAALFKKKAAGTKKNEPDSNKPFSRKAEMQKKLDGVKL
jgi:hypothetical protein